MALGKYYCDYCDKQFQDTASARKRHLLGLQHLRAKAQWYASSHSLPLQDTPTVAAATGFAKGLCNRFLNTGFCQYGDSCKYFHPNSTPQNSVTQAVVGSQFIEGSFLPSQGALLGKLAADVCNESTKMNFRGIICHYT